MVAPSAKTLFDHVILAGILKTEGNEETAELRGDRAAEACYEELAALLELIPTWSVTHKSGIRKESDEEVYATEKGIRAWREAHELPPNRPKF